MLFRSFRGQFVPGDGNVQGPYISQFLLQPAFFGAQLLNQQYQTFLAADAGGCDFMTSVIEFQLIQNGGNSGRKLAFDPTHRFIRAGRDLAAYTHVDVLYQAYLVATPVLAGINTPLNSGTPISAPRQKRGSERWAGRTRWGRSRKWRHEPSRPRGSTTGWWTCGRGRRSMAPWCMRT